jgi:hypothetical protein
MKRLILLAIVVLLPAPLFAQASATGAGLDLRERVASANQSRILPLAADAEANAQVQGRPATPPAATPPPEQTFRRRGSMVGYIDDAPIVSKLRIRFDAATQDRAPDRAEFFYAKCGCYRDLPADHPAYDPDSPGPRPGAADSVNFQQWHIQGEYGVSNKFSVFGELPFRWIQPQSFIPGTGAGFPNQGGLSDLRFGFKYGLLAADQQAVTLQVREYVPTGDASLGLGTNHATLEPALLVSAGRNRVAVESQIGIWLPLGGSKPAPTNLDGHFAGKVFFYGIGPSVEVYRTGKVGVAPVVELVGWHVVDGFESVATDASGTNIVNLKIGGRVGWDRSSVYVGYGHALTDASWYDDIVRFEYRYSF